MCLIIHRDADGPNLPDNIIMHQKHANPDGFGIAWRDKVTGMVDWVKFSPQDFERFYQRLKSIDADTEIEYVAHFRTATHGPKCEEMSHPFVYDDAKEGQVVVFHNGIIPIQTPKNISDTAQFVESVLAKLTPRWWVKAAYRFLIGESIGYSRLLIMTDNETVTFGRGWEKRDGINYSTTPIPASYGKASYYVPGVGNVGATSGKGEEKGGQKWTPKASSWVENQDWVKGADGFWHHTSTLSPQELSGLNSDELHDEPDTSAVEDTEPEVTDSGLGWYQSGHYIEALTADEDKHGDQFGTAICTICRTIGDFYLIDGTTYIDIKHGDDEDPDEEGLLPSDDATIKQALLS